jgi:hypothetical protein
MLEESSYDWPGAKGQTETRFQTSITTLDNMRISIINFDYLIEIKYI